MAILVIIVNVCTCIYASADVNDVQGPTQFDIIKPTIILPRIQYDIDYSRLSQYQAGADIILNRGYPTRAEMVAYMDADTGTVGQKWSLANERCRTLGNCAFYFGISGISPDVNNLPQYGYSYSYIMVFASSKPLRLIKVPSSLNSELASNDCYMLCAPVDAEVYTAGFNAYRRTAGSMVGEVYCMPYEPFLSGSTGVTHSLSEWDGRIGKYKYCTYPSVSYDASYNTPFHSATVGLTESNSCFTCFTSSFFLQYNGNSLGMWSDGTNNAVYLGQSRVLKSVDSLDGLIGTDINYSTSITPDTTLEEYMVYSSFFGYSPNQVYYHMPNAVKSIVNVLSDDRVIMPNSITIPWDGKNYTLLDPTLLSDHIGVINVVLSTITIIVIVIYGLDVICEIFGFQRPKMHLDDQT